MLGNKKIKKKALFFEHRMKMLIGKVTCSPKGPPPPIKTNKTDIFKLTHTRSIISACEKRYHGHCSKDCLCLLKSMWFLE